MVITKKSPPYKGGETGNLNKEASERSRWNRDSNENHLGGNLDTWHSTPNYGMLNENFESVTLLVDDEERALVPLLEETPDVRSVQFVATMFKNFRKKYLEDLSGSPIGIPSHFTDFIPVKAYENFENNYNNYMNFVITEIASDFFADQSVVDYRTFKRKLEEYIRDSASEWPITKSGYNLSSHCSVYSSGFYIDLMRDQNYNLDRIKGEIVNTQSFICFCEYVDRFGFLVDKNAPWRIVINLNSDVTQKAINVHGGRKMSYKDTLTRMHRSKTNYDDYSAFRNFVVALYSTLLYNSDGDQEREEEGFQAYDPDLPTRVGDLTIGRFQNLKHFMREFTTEETLSLLLMTRIFEINVPHSGIAPDYDSLREKIFQAHDLYSGRFPNPLTPSLNILGKSTRRWIKAILVRKYLGDQVGRGGYYNL